MAISRSNTFEAAAPPTPAGLGPSAPSTASIYVKDAKGAKDAKETKYAKFSKDGKERKAQAGDHLPATAKELYERLKDYGKSNDLEGLVDRLLPVMIQQYSRVKKGEATVDEIMMFLLDDDENIHPAAQYMDHCIRWCILVKSLEPNKYSGTPDATKAIARWIVEHWPMLAFVNLNSEKGAVGDQYRNETGDGDGEDSGDEQFSYKAKCKSKHKIERSCTPFHLSAKAGNYEIIDDMLKNARQIYFPLAGRPAPVPDPPKPKGDFQDLVLGEDPDSNRGETALMLALNAKTTPYETLEKLLCVTGTKTPLDDSAFSEAVTLGFDRAVEAYLRHGLQLTADDFHKYITVAFENLGKPLKGRLTGRSVRGDKETCRKNIVKSLVRRANKPETFTEKVMEEIIQRNLTDVWDDKHPDVPAKSETSRLLHMAVLYQRHAFVERFVETYPTSLKARAKLLNDSNEGLKYPLWYNNHRWDPAGKKFKKLLPEEDRSSERVKIRNVIVTKMIHLLGMDLLHDILHQSHEPFDEFCFDMSRFNGSAYQVSDFIGSLIYQDSIEQRPMLKYEQTLKYVEFPSLDMMPEHREVFKESTNMKKEHREVFQILDWLDLKGVKKIIKLVVPDRLVNPHDELEMAGYVRKFQVEVLDWKVLDLSISIFKDLSPSPTTVKTKTETKTETTATATTTITTTTTTTTTTTLNKDAAKIDKKKHTGHLQELYLYSSGKRAAVHHWFNKEDGIPSLGETCTEKQANDLVNEIHELQQDRFPPGNKPNAYDPVEIAWYPSPSPADLSKIAERLSPRLAAWLGDLTKYVNKRNERMPDKKHRPTRVAILDNGVLSISPVTPESSASRGTKSQGLSVPGTDAASAKTIDTGNKARASNIVDTNGTQTLPQQEQQRQQQQSGEKPQDSMGRSGISGGSGRNDGNGDKGLWSRIKAGRSFVDSNSKFCPWQFPSHPHGTQMANLICALDPLCEIYVGRVAEDAFGIKAENVTKAIKWAIEEDVDIISMSLAISEKNAPMRDALEEASDTGIVITCSMHDEGSRTSDAYPAEYRTGDLIDSILVLAACDEYGKPLREVDDNKIDYKLIGNHVPAGVVPFVKSEEYISGSSVATALAAGLASLALTCDRLANPEKNIIKTTMLLKGGNKLDTDKTKYRLGIVKKHLEEMAADKDDKFVILDKFGGIAAPSIGQDVVTQAGRKLNKHDIPKVETVLKERFGMKSPSKLPSSER